MQIIPFRVIVIYLHALELRGQLGAGQLELLDDVGNLLEAVAVFVFAPLTVRDHQKRGTLKQQHLICIHDVGKLLQRALERFHVGYQHVHDARPSSGKQEHQQIIKYHPVVM